jgi:transcriptional antiterminator Rof (Rho-off)
VKSLVEVTESQWQKLDCANADYLELFCGFRRELAAVAI